MAPPINVQDWYGDRHTCQIASGALGKNGHAASHWRMPDVTAGMSATETTTSTLIWYPPRTIYHFSKPTRPSSCTRIRSTRTTTLWSLSTTVIITSSRTETDVWRLCGKSTVRSTTTPPASEFTTTAHAVRTVNTPPHRQFTGWGKNKILKYPNAKIATSIYTHRVPKN